MDPFRQYYDLFNTLASGLLYRGVNNVFLFAKELKC